MRKLICGIAGAIALGLSVNAAAVPVTFDLAADSTASIQLNSTDFLCSLTGCGASVTVNPNLGGESREMSAGETWAFNFFTIDFYGLGGGSGTVSASLGFDEPTGAVDASSNAKGSFFNFIFTAGNLQWTKQPGSYSLLDGTTYSVMFENLSGITFGQSVDVRAYLTLISEPGAASVPEPGTLVLFGLGLLGVGLANRRRVAAAAASTAA